MLLHTNPYRERDCFVIFPEILLCTDLDRTLIPNGDEPESPNSRILFNQLCSRPEVSLVYVSGRDKDLILQAIHDFKLPYPDFAISDVGSTIYKITNKTWNICYDWTKMIAHDWRENSTETLVKLLKTIPDLCLQEASKQNTYKLSYYLSLQKNHVDIINRIIYILRNNAFRSNVIWSIDTIKNIGLIDILPQSANKLTSIHWLANKLNFKENNVIFAGDSGNDMDVICSDIPSIIVANATSEFKSHARSMVQKSDLQDTLYIASGFTNRLNGNYAAGILEGICHYKPEVEEWLLSELLST